MSTICRQTEIQFVHEVSVCQLGQFHGLGWGVREQLSGPLPPEIHASPLTATFTALGNMAWQVFFSTCCYKELPSNCSDNRGKRGKFPNGLSLVMYIAVTQVAAAVTFAIQIHVPVSVETTYQVSSASPSSLMETMLINVTSGEEVIQQFLKSSGKE